MGRSTCPKRPTSWRCHSSSTTPTFEACHSSVAILACLCPVLLHMAIALAARVVFSSSQKPSTRDVFNSSILMRRRLLLFCLSRPIFCSGCSSSDPSPHARAHWTICFSPCFWAMRATTTTWSQVRKSINSNEVSCRKSHRPHKLQWANLNTPALHPPRLETVGPFQTCLSRTEPCRGRWPWFWPMQ